MYEHTIKKKWKSFTYSVWLFSHLQIRNRLGMDTVDDTAEENQSDVKVKAEVKEEESAEVEMPAKPQKPEIPKIPFKCENCGFVAVCNYKGTTPPFSKNIKFTEECYVMQDPFSPPPGNATSKSNSEYFIVIGADCCSCTKVVCAATTCSLFYQKSYCFDCAHQSITSFPLEIQSKIRKILSSQRWWCAEFISYTHISLELILYDIVKYISRDKQAKSVSQRFNLSYYIWDYINFFYAFRIAELG